MKTYDANSLKGQTIYLGIDVHARTWHITIQIKDLILHSGSISSEFQLLAKILEPFKGIKVCACYEAGYFGFTLHDKLVSWGAECLVVAPNQIPILSGSKVKTDQIDSKKLANFLVKGLLKGVYVPTLEEREQREPIRMRQRLMQERNRVMNRIKALFQFHGIAIPLNRGKWTPLYINRLKACMPARGMIRFSFELYFKELEFLDQRILEVKNIISAMAKSAKFKKRMELLTSIPGIGTLIGMEFLVEIQDVKRFKRSEELSAYVGLTPSQYSSGDKVRLGRITRSGKTHLRALLVEASWALVRKDPHMGAVFEKLKYRAGAKRAIVAVAHKLLIIMRSLLISNQPYRMDTLKIAA